MGKPVAVNGGRRILRFLEPVVGPVLAPVEILWDSYLSARVEFFPETFQWVDGIPQTCRDRMMAKLTGYDPWEGWRNWID